MLAGDQDIAPIGTEGEVARPSAATIDDFDPDQVTVRQDAIGGDGVFATGRHTEELPVGADVDVSDRVVAQRGRNGRMFPQRTQRVFSVGIDRDRTRNLVGDVEYRFAGVENRMPRSRARFGIDRMHTSELIGLRLYRIQHQFVGPQVCRDDEAAVRGHRRRMGVWSALTGFVGTAADMLAQVIEASDVCIGADAQQSHVAGTVVRHHQMLPVAGDDDVAWPVTATRAAHPGAEDSIAVRHRDDPARQSGGGVGL